MSTLAGSVTATALTLRLNDSPLTTYPRTLILDATGTSELVVAYSTDLDGNVTVARGAFGTAAVAHADGVSVDLYDGSPTAAATVPTLAEVLAEGRTTDGLAISGGPLPTTGSYGADIAFGGGSNDPAVGGDLTLGGGQATAGLAGGGIFIYAGSGDAGTDPGAYIELYGGDGSGNPGAASLSTDGSTGPGPLVSDGTNLSYSRAAFVANGSTVDQLRDSLIAAGLMDPS